MVFLAIFAKNQLFLDNRDKLEIWRLTSVELVCAYKFRELLRNRLLILVIDCT